MAEAQGVAQPRDPASRFLRFIEGLRSQFDLTYIEADQLATRIEQGDDLIDAVTEIRARREQGDS